MNTDYTKSPVYEMVPTHCSCCKRPLVDATSVEFGVGPVCRDKYGYEDAHPVTAEVEAAMTDVMSKFSDLAFAGRVMEAVKADDSRKAANLLNRLMAVSLTKKVSEADILLGTKALATLGYTTLSARVSEVLTTVKIEEVDGRVKVVAPFNEAFVDATRAIKGSRFDRDSKCWTVPSTEKAALWGAIKESFSGKMGTGPKGVFKI